MTTCENFELENYQLDLVRKSSGTLIVSYEPMTACLRNPSRDRPGWSETFFRQRDDSVLYVKPLQPNWYRRPDLFQWFEAHQSLFSDYDRVVPMGGSMGGYGALAFAEVSNATEVLALNPQSTLARDLVPWENRFALGRKEDWSGAYRDAATTLKGQVFVVADRFEKPDWQHIERLGNVNTVNFPMVGHKIPMWLLQLDGMKPISSAILDGKKPDEITSMMRRIIRKRRSLERWWAGLLEEASRRGKLEQVRPLFTAAQIGTTIPIQGDEKNLHKLRVLLYRTVAENEEQQDNSLESQEWVRRATEYEARLAT